MYIPLRDDYGWENERFVALNDFGMHKQIEAYRYVNDTPIPDILNAVLQIDSFHGNFKIAKRYLPFALLQPEPQYFSVYTYGNYMVVDEFERWYSEHVSTRFGRIPHYALDWFPAWLNDPKAPFNQIQANARTNRLNRAYTNPIYDFPNARNLRSILTTVHVDPDNPRVVYWFEDYISRGDREPFGDHPPLTVFEDEKPKSMRWAKFLAMLRRKFGYRFSDKEIEEASTWVGDNLKAPEYVFKIGTGREVRNTYNEEYFGSCMYESSATRFYDDQPNVNILRIEDGKTHKLIGRALLWNAERRNSDGVWEPATVLDRIYPSDGGAHIRATIKHAKENGWYYKVFQEIDGTMSDKSEFRVLVDVSSDNYPYMDTFAYPDGYPKNSQVHLYNHSMCEFEFRYTDNENPFDDSEYEPCAICGDRTYIDDLTYVEDEGSICEHCFSRNYVYSHLQDRAIPLDIAVEVCNVTWDAYVDPHDDEVEWSDAENAYFWTGYLYRTRQVPYVELTDGGYAGQIALAENAIEHDGRYWHESDRDEYEKFLASEDEDQED